MLIFRTWLLDSIVFKNLAKGSYIYCIIEKETKIIQETNVTETLKVLELFFYDPLTIRRLLFIIKIYILKSEALSLDSSNIKIFSNGLTLKVIKM